MVFDKKEYMRAYHKKRYEKDKEKLLERSRKWHENNKEYHKERMKEYNKNNKEHKKEYDKEYRENNKEHYKAINKEYRDNNKEKIKEYFKKYRQTEHGQMVRKILSLERQGIIYYDMKELYYTWKMTKYCHYCWVELIEGNFGANRKCLDHNHETGEPRGVICQACNVRDVFKGC